MPRAAAVLLAVALGLALGVGAHAVRLGGHPTLHWASALGVPWLVGAFGAGVAGGSRRAAAALGALTLVVGTLAYYAVIVATAGRVGLLYAVPVGLAWALASALAGAVFGLAGALWRSGAPRAQALGVAGPAGALVGEALALAPLWSARPARAVLAAEALAGLVLPFLLLRPRGRLALALALAAVAAVGLAGAELGVRGALRGVGWRGA